MMPGPSTLQPIHPQLLALMGRMLDEGAVLRSTAAGWTLSGPPGQWAEPVHVCGHTVTNLLRAGLIITRDYGRCYRLSDAGIRAYYAGGYEDRGGR